MKFVLPQQTALVDNNINVKNDLINKMFTKVIEEKEIKPELKKFFDKTQFLANKYPMANNIRLRFEDNNIPTFEYMEQKYSFIPSHTSMSQYDISELLKELYIQETIVLGLMKNINEFKSGNIDKMTSFLDDSKGIITEMENINMASFSDKNRISNSLTRIGDKTDCVSWGKLEAFNRLEAKTKMTIGILAGSGLGKSLVMEALHANSKDDIVLHFSLELPEDLFIRRIIVALGWVSDDDIEYLSKSQIKYYAEKMAKEFPYWHYTTVDTDSAKINVNKIEKMIKYYRTKYAKELSEGKKMKIFIDYLQIMDEQLDPMNCRISDRLHSIAVQYDVCMVIGLQANDEASKYGKPAETSMIAFVKSLKNGFDIIQSFYSTHIIESPNITILNSETKKHRTGKFSNFCYTIDHCKKGEDNWKLSSKLREKVNPKINLEHGTHEDFPEDEIKGDE